MFFIKKMVGERQLYLYLLKQCFIPNMVSVPQVGGNMPRGSSGSHFSGGGRGSGDSIC